MNKIGWPTLFSLAAGLSGCEEPQGNGQSVLSSSACTPPRTHWMRQGNFEGLTPPINRLSLDRNGMIYWQGERKSSAQISQYLQAASTLVPQPIVFLDTEMGAPCAAVERLRDEMDRQLDCAVSGSCAEGIWRVWQATPRPPGQPPS